MSKSIISSVDALTAETTKLLELYSDGLTSIDGSVTEAQQAVEDAKSQVTLATTQATNASKSATTAKGHADDSSDSATASASSASAASSSATAAKDSATAASGSATTASNQATAAANSATAALNSSNDSADSATASQESAEAAQGVFDDIKVFNPYPHAMTKAEFNANREQNKQKYAGSGCLDNPLISTTEQDGSLLFPASAANVFTQCKTKKVVDGVTHYLDKSEIRLPPVCDGTKSYDSATGIVTDHLTYLDPKYDNTAALSHSDAVSRCFEGLCKNGDFRLGTEGWTAPSDRGSLEVSNGIATITDTTGIAIGGSAMYVSGNYQVSAGTTYKVSVVCNDTGEDGAHLRLGYYNDPNKKYVPLALGLNEFTFQPIGNSGGDTFLIYAVKGQTIKVSNFSIRPVTSNLILTRQDLVFLEVNPNAECTVFKPLGNNQYGTNTADGITLKKLTDLGIPQSVSAFGEWDSETVGYGELISALTDAQLKTVLSNPKNNLCFDPVSGKLLQAEYKICVEEGCNDTDTVDERMAKLGYVKDTVDVTRYNHADGRQAIGVCLRQTLNSGAYHPVFNPEGCREFAQHGVSGYNWYQLPAHFNAQTKDCFVQATSDKIGFYAITGHIGSRSGRPSSYPDAYYDAVYSHQIKDLRLSAHKQDVNKLRVDAMRQAVSGEMRGWGKVPFSHNFFSLNVVSENCGWTGSATFLAFPKGTITHQDTGKNSKDTIGHIVVGDNVFDCYSFRTNSVAADYIYLLTKYGDVRSKLAGNPLVQGASFVYLTPQNNTLAWTDILGLPSTISECFPNGVQGQWIPKIPDNVTKNYNLNRKSTGTNITRVQTEDSGSTWLQSSTTVDSIQNALVNFNIPASRVTLVQYPTLSNFTEPADNSKVVGEVGDVFASFRPQNNRGNRLNSSLAEAIAKSDNAAKHTNNLVVEDYAVDVHQAGAFSIFTDVAPVHSLVTLGQPINNSSSVKALSTITERDGLLYLQLHGSELHYDTTAANWGDDSTIPVIDGDGTKTDDNGHTVKTFCHHSQIPLGIASHSDSSQSKD